MPSNLKSNLALSNKVIHLKLRYYYQKKMKLIHKILYNSTFKFRFFYTLFWYWQYVQILMSSLCSWFLQHLIHIILLITLSYGSRECNHDGRKFQVLNCFGRHCGALTCNILTRVTNTSTVRKGIPTAIKTTEPACDNAKKAAGSRKNIPTRYTIANHRYWAVVLPRPLAK